MQVSLLSPDEVAQDWEAIVEDLWEAVRQDPQFSIHGLYNRLVMGTALLFKVSDGASGYWVVSLNSEVNQNGVDELVAWTEAIAGKIDGGPKAKLSLIRQAVGALEETLRMAGVKAHRLCGRDWSKVLPEYVEYSGASNGLERQL